VLKGRVPAFEDGARERGVSSPPRRGQRGARGGERGAAAAVLLAVQRRAVLGAVDSGLLLVKYTLRRRQARPWGGHGKPRRVDCAAGRTDGGV